MQRERVADDIYVFTSALYAQVTAGLVNTTEGAVLIDTLVFPEETLMLRRFVENRLGSSVRYVVNTHFHADHSTGTCFFPEATIISHALCRQYLDTRGRDSLARLKESSTEMAEVELVLPTLVFDEGLLEVTLGGKTFQFWHTPGHSLDSIVCLVKEERVLFAADTLMPIPYFVDGSYEAFLSSLEGLRNGNYENVIQGHGEVILRGEVEEKIESDIRYLHRLKEMIETAQASKSPEKALAAISLEKCGKSRILLNGAVEQLHRNNVQSLVNRHGTPT